MKPFAITDILAATDLSASSVPALEYARLFSETFAAKLAVIYSDPILYPLDVMPADTFYVTVNTSEEPHLRAGVEQHAGPVMQEWPYEVELTVGQPVPAILGTAKRRQSDLIVVGTHLRHGWRRALFGSVSDGVLHGSLCPVLTVASQDQRMRDGRPKVANIVCPVNFTDVGKDGLRAAVHVAAIFSAHLTIVHVVEPDDGNAAADEDEVRRWIAPELQDVCSFRELVVRGGAAERVLDCADDIGADLLVAGAQHRVFRDATVIGTTSDRLIRFAPCPVMIVPRAAVAEDRQSSQPAKEKVTA